MTQKEIIKYGKDYPLQCKKYRSERSNNAKMAFNNPNALVIRKDKMLTDNPMDDPIIRERQLQAVNTPEFLADCSKRMTDRYQIQENRDKQRVSTINSYLRGEHAIHPNNFEIKVHKYLDREFPGQFTLGCGKISVCNSLPDFVHKTKKIVVEACGTYFHLKKKGLTRDEKHIEEARLRARYEPFGYILVILWEDEPIENLKVKLKKVL
jgi:hypothetical protein